MRRRCVYMMGILLFALAGCGGDNDGANAESLSADEQLYADEIAATATEQGFTSEEAKCTGEGLVRAFGVARAKELSFASDNTPKLSRLDAEKSIGVLDKCTNLAIYILRQAQGDLKLSDAEVERCAQLLDRAKVRELFVVSEMNQQVDKEASRQLSAAVIGVLDDCVNLSVVLVRALRPTINLSDAEVARCAEMLDRAKVRALFTGSMTNDQVDKEASKQLQDDLIAALPRCRG